MLRELFSFRTLRQYIGADGKLQQPENGRHRHNVDQARHHDYRNQGNALLENHGDGGSHERSNVLEDVLGPPSGSSTSSSRSSEAIILPTGHQTVDRTRSRKVSRNGAIDATAVSQSLIPPVLYHPPPPYASIEYPCMYGLPGNKSALLEMSGNPDGPTGNEPLFSGQVPLYCATIPVICSVCHHGLLVPACEWLDESPDQIYLQPMYHY